MCQSGSEATTSICKNGLPKGSMFATPSPFALDQYDTVAHAAVEFARSLLRIERVAHAHH